MKIIKTLPRSVMGHDRVSVLVMISIHWDITVDPGEVINILSRKNLSVCLFNKMHQEVNYYLLIFDSYYINVE